MVHVGQSTNVLGHEQVPRYAAHRAQHIGVLYAPVLDLHANHDRTLFRVRILGPDEGREQDGCQQNAP
jgi:hypothetical protein